jgi:hypothetical protein
MASAIQNDPSRKNAVASRSALVTLPPVGDRVELGGPIPPAAFLHYHTPPPVEHFAPLCGTAAASCPRGPRGILTLGVCHETRT